MSLRGLLRGFGLKVGPTTPSRFAGRVRELVEGNATLEVIAAALLVVHETLRRELAGFEKRVLLRDNLDEKGGGDQSFEAAADSGVMIVADLKLCKGFFGAAV